MSQDDRASEIRPVSPTEILDRFLIRHEISPDPATVAVSMPVAGHVNPLNGAPTAAALTLLVDTVGGLANHRLCGEGQGTVTTELAADLVPEAVDNVCRASSPPVIATGRTIGARGATSLAVCTLTCAGRDVRVATVRSFCVDAVPHLAPPKESLIRSDETTLAELLSATRMDSSPGFATPTLVQRHDPILVNSLGVVNGRVFDVPLSGRGRRRRRANGYADAAGFTAGELPAPPARLSGHALRRRRPAPRETNGSGHGPRVHRRHPSRAVRDADGAPESRVRWQRTAACLT